MLKHPDVKVRWEWDVYVKSSTVEDMAMRCITNDTKNRAKIILINEYNGLLKDTDRNSQQRRHAQHFMISSLSFMER